MKEIGGGVFNNTNRFAWCQFTPPALLGDACTARPSASKVQIQSGVRVWELKNALNNAFLRLGLLVDLIGSYSNLAVLNQLESVINEVMSA